MPIASGSIFANLVPPSAIKSGGSIWNLAIESQEVDTATLAASLRMLDVELTLGYQGSMSLGARYNEASVRGNTTIKSGTTVTTGFVYGTQGKVTIKGSLTSANWSAGILGQIDLSAGHHTGTGWLSAIWGDMGATSLDASDVNAVVSLLTNTTADEILAGIHIDTNSTYGMSFTDEGGGHGAGKWIKAAAVGGSQTTKLKVFVNGAAMYIPLYTS